MVRPRPRHHRHRRHLLGSLWAACARLWMVHAHYGKLVQDHMAHRLLGLPLAASL